MTSTDQTWTAAPDALLEDHDAPVLEEITVTDLPITGDLPPEPSGTCLRVGPDTESPADPATHRSSEREESAPGLVGSTGEVGAAGDDAAMGPFFALLQENALGRRVWTTRADLRIAIVVWIGLPPLRRTRRTGTLDPRRGRDDRDRTNRPGRLTPPDRAAVPPHGCGMEEPSTTPGASSWRWLVTGCPLRAGISRMKTSGTRVGSVKCSTR